MGVRDIVISSRTATLLRSSIVWDNHGCMPPRAEESFLPQLERYRAAGVIVASISCAGFCGSYGTSSIWSVRSMSG